MVGTSCSPENIFESQEEDQKLKKFRDWKKADRQPTWQSQTLKSYWTQWNSLVVEKVILERVLKSDVGLVQRIRTVVPRSNVVFHNLYNGTSVGYLGVTKAVQKVRKRFNWVICSEDVKEWCRKYMSVIDCKKA